VIINRRSVKIKIGCRDEAINMLVAELSQNSIPSQVYSVIYGKLDVVSFDMQFESIQEHDRAWQEWGEKEGTSKFLERWHELIADFNDGLNEIYTIHSSNIPQDGTTFAYTERLTTPVKPGRIGEIIELTSQAHEVFGMPFQVLSADFGPFDRLVVDFVFNSFEEKDQVWSNWANSEAGQTFFRIWEQLISAGSTLEMLANHK
jgi:hypothetical protein